MCGSLLLPQACVCAGLVSSVAGASCMGLRLLISDDGLLDPLLLLQDVQRLESLIPTSGLSRTELSIVLLDYSPVGVLLSSKSSACSSAATIAHRLVRVDALLLLADHLLLDFLLTMRSSARTGLAASASDFLHLEILPSLHDCSCFDLPSPIYGKACAELSVFMPEMFHAGSVMLVQASACLGSAFFLMGMTWPSALTSLLDCASLDVPTAPHSLARAGFTIAILDCAGADSAVSPRCLNCPEAGLLVVGAVRMDLASTILDFVSSGSLTFLQSFSRCETAASALDLLHPDLTMSVRSAAHLGPVTSALDFAFFESPVLLRSYTRVDPMLLSGGTARLDLILPASGGMLLGFFLSLRSSFRFGALMFVMDATYLGFLSSAQSFA